jgi:AraC family transcriptional activator of pobA
MRKTNIPYLSLDSVGNASEKPGLDISEEGIAIFDSFIHLPINDYPTKVDAAAMAVILKGSAHITINLQEFNVEAHNLILLMPNQIVQSLERSDDFSGIFVAISSKVLNELTLGVQSNLNVFLYSRDHPITAIDETEENLLMEYHQFIRQQLRNRDNVYRKAIDTHLILALTLEIMNLVNRHRPQRIVRKTRKEEQFERFLTLVGEEYREKRTIAYYADKLCITPKYLSALSKSLTGITAGDWIDRSVIQEAKALLKKLVVHHTRGFGHDELPQPVVLRPLF